MERKWQVLAVTSLGVFMASLDSTIVNISFPAILRHFEGVRLTDLSWVLNGYTVVFAAALIPAGRIADLAGRKRVFLAGLALFTLASALCGWAPTHHALIAARLLQGLGGAMMTPPALGLVLAEFPPSQRATAVGLWSVAGGLAAATGPPLGGLLNDLASWRWIFLINVPVGILGGVAAMRILREQREAGAVRLPDLLGSVILAGAVGALALGIVKGPDWGWGSPRVGGTLLLAALLFAAFFYRAARHPAPVVDLSLWHVRSFGVANLATLLFGMSFFAMFLASSLFLTSVWGYSALRAGLAIGPGPLSAAIFGGIAGRIGDRTGPRATLVPGALIMAAGLLWIILRTEATPAYLSVWLPGFVVTGVGVGLVIPSLSGAAVAGMQPSRFSLAGGVNNTARTIGGVLGVAVLIAIVGTPRPEDALATFRTGFIFSAACILLCGLAGIALGNIRVAAPAPPAPAVVSPTTAGGRRLKVEG